MSIRVPEVSECNIPVRAAQNHRTSRETPTAKPSHKEDKADRRENTQTSRAAFECAAG